MATMKAIQVTAEQIKEIRDCIEGNSYRDNTTKFVVPVKGRAGTPPLADYCE